MRKNVLIIAMLFTGIMFSQTKKNGTVYSEHPAIDAVESMMQAFYAGDSATVAKYLADDFKSYSGTTLSKDPQGRSREWFLGGPKWITKNWSYITYERTEGAYPDAIEYKKDDELWVQTWDNFSAMDNRTGVKLDMPMHRLFKLNKDNKIVAMFTYDNDLPWAENRRSFAPRTNGVIYNNHENINTVRKVMGHLEHGNAEEGFSYFAENARFTHLDLPAGESLTLEEEKAGYQQMLENWTIESIDVVGYPDYLEYELGDSRVVQSWWNARMTRKSDGKKVVLPLMFTHDFNDEGKITIERGYYTLQSLSDN